MAEVRHSEESAYSKEMAKWNKPYVFQPYPRMVYKARPHPVTGKASAGFGADIVEPLSGRVLHNAEQFAASCQMIVNSDSEFANAMNAGWRETPDKAVNFYEERENKISTATAERHYSDRKMSEKAQAEAKAVDESTDQHVPEIPSKRGPGRPRIHPAA